MVKPPKTTLGATVGYFWGVTGGIRLGELPPKSKIMGVAGVNPTKTTLKGFPLLWQHPKVQQGGPGWVREHRRVSAFGGPHPGPPFIHSGGAGPL